MKKFKLEKEKKFFQIKMSKLTLYIFNRYYIKFYSTYKYMTNLQNCFFAYFLLR